jgi:hypothetical protein
MPPERLFKYTTTVAATAILTKQSLRWSSPVAFNDPFDLKYYFHGEFSWNDLRQEVLRRLREMIRSPIAPIFAAGNELVERLQWFRENLSGHSDEHIATVLEEGLNETFDLCERLAREERDHWLEERNLWRVICFAERPDNLLMWSHYAEQHAGVVLEFETKLFEQSASSQAIKVRYSDVVPTIFTYQQFLGWLLGQNPFPDVSDYTLAVASTKSTHWSYEQEWRLLRYDDPPKFGNYSCFEYPSDALVGVYFGCRIDPGKRDVLVSLLEGKYPHAQIHTMREKSGRYELEMDPA